MSDTTAAFPIAPGTWMIDLHFQGTPGVIAAYLLAGRSAGDGLALIETGPASTLPTLRRGIEAAGFRPADLTDILVTHIHLDHAGGAAALLDEAPEARVHVHPLGRPHVIDPAKLWSSAGRIYGDRMETLWGTTGPAPAERVVSLEDGAALTVAGRTLEAIFTPGHASHHVAYRDAAARTLFTGDAGGVRLAGTGYVCPPVPPPDLDFDAWEVSIDRMLGLGARRLCLTHFGPFEDPAAHLGQLERNLGRYLALAEETLGRGGDRAALAGRLHAAMEAGLLAGETGEPSLLHALELASPSSMAAMGLERYVTKRGR